MLANASQDGQIRSTEDVGPASRTRVAEETLRGWLRLYRQRGFEGLKAKPRSDLAGSRALPQEGKGLRKAIREVFGRHEIVQRCQVHKERNVLQLPEAKKASVRTTISQPYDATSHEAALTQLKNLARILAKDHPGAAESLREGLEETLAARRLGLSGALERTFRTINPAENVNDGMRRLSRRVKRWRSGGMVLRWAAAGALEAQGRFRHW